VVSLFVALLWMQLTPLELPPKLESTVATIRSEPPRQGHVRVIYHDDLFLFVEGPHPDRRKQHGSLFVHSMRSTRLRRWRQITAVSTAGGRFGSSKPTNDADAKRLSVASMGWDFTMYAALPSMPLPAAGGGSFTLPDEISYDAATDFYEMKLLSSWGVPSAETVVYILRKDLVEQFTKDQGR
jgi:hypothetical protein